MNFEIVPIGWVASCFDEKFGVPRQSGLVNSASAVIHFYHPYDHPDAFAGLEQSSHLWIQFIFHLNKPSDTFSTKVRPPRLGGNEKQGVFATRSPNRPNRIGLSAVKLDRVCVEGGCVSLQVSGMDLVDGTPVIDIKPYLPYADAINAQHPFVQPISSIEHIQFSDSAETALAKLSQKKYPNMRQLIVDVLKQDPRPAYLHAQESRLHGVALLGCNVQWRVKGNPCVAEVVSVNPLA